MSSLTEIAEDILANARKMDAYTNTNLKGGHESLVGLPANIENARLALINSTQTLKRLALGPKGTLMEILYSVSTSHLTPSLYSLDLKISRVHRSDLTSCHIHLQSSEICASRGFHLFCRNLSVNWH